jgi:hypothetical protein
MIKNETAKIEKSIKYYLTKGENNERKELLSPKAGYGQNTNPNTLH